MVWWVLEHESLLLPLIDRTCWMIIALLSSEMRVTSQKHMKRKCHNDDCSVSQTEFQEEKKHPTSVSSFLPVTRHHHRWCKSHASQRMHARFFDLHFLPIINHQGKAGPTIFPLLRRTVVVPPHLFLSTVGVHFIVHTTLCFRKNFTNK